jgi:potassium/chloride transporter 4/5/6
VLLHYVQHSLGLRHYLSGSLLGHLQVGFSSISTHFYSFRYVEYKGARSEWGSGLRGLALSTAQYSIMKIDENESAKSWRPQLLLLHSMPWTADQLDLRFANLCHLASQLKAGKGLTLVVSFVRGDSSLQVNIDIRIYI